MSQNNISLGRLAALIGAALALLVCAFLAPKAVESVGADEIVVQQDPVDGELHFWTTPGLHWQNFGSVTTYPKSSQFWFSASPEDGGDKDQSIFVRFNDGGTAQVSGSLRIELPTDKASLELIQTKFGSEEALISGLIKPTVDRAVFMTGPLMSSKESYADRKSDLISFIADQVNNGVYKTETNEVEVEENDMFAAADTANDPTGVSKRGSRTVAVTTIVRGKDGTALRQEESPLGKFGVRTYSFSVTSIQYDGRIEDQIKRQQQALMDVQTAMADAKKAQQDRITAAENGRANAEKAKWAEEEKKATALVKAEQEKAVAILDAEKARDVAKLGMEAAEYTKAEQILLGEGEAARKKAVMSADGALDKKLAAYVEVQKAWAVEVGKQRWVPEVQMGSSQGQSGSAATDLMNLLATQSARDLALDLKQMK